jgi:flagellar biosynthesis chaperone FliJ
MEWLLILYGRLGAAAPGISLAVVAVIGAIVFGGGWWLIGEKYRQEHEPKPGIVAVSGPDPRVEVLENSVRDYKDRVQSLENQLNSATSALTDERAARQRVEAVVEKQNTRKEEIQYRLTQFMTEGNRIRSEWGTRMGKGEELQQDSARQVLTWRGHVGAYLREALGEVAAVRFESAPPSQGVVVGLNMKVGGIWQGLQGSLQKLDEIIRDVK